ncbi:tetratricopeptide repeat protein [Nocardia sp. NPDC005998]|uniref:ATP-binding protein n=1 Tax=Nocardia sp. NPDC005998 TaxID=3156894 RepID=UPI00339DC944
MSEHLAGGRAQQVNVAGDNTGSIRVSTVYEAAPRPVVTNALRRDAAAFIGRDDELRRILEAARLGRVVAIHTIDGMAGIGKTALATRAAHELAERFPDGQYFVELHAHTPGQKPADPTEVLAGLLIELGIDPGGIPDSLVGRRDLWRDRLDGKRVLLVLDDARDHAQIEPLLPTGRQCLTLVTSRRRLIALDDAVPLTLDILAPDAAVELFTTLACRTCLTEADLGAVGTIVQSCGYLPMAIVLLAGRLAHHPAWTITGLASEFAGATDRLGELDTGHRAVRAAFTMSYQDLPPQRQRIFRYLGLRPGLDTDVYATAALIDCPVPEVRRELEALYVDHLVDETTSGRYRLHDLLREYARALATTDSAVETHQALQRLLDYYLLAAGFADSYLSLFPRSRADLTLPSAAALPQFDDHVQAVAWLRTERANLLACLEHAEGQRQTRLPALTEVLAGLLDQDGPWPLARLLHQRAAAAAKDLGDRIGEATALDNLGFVHGRIGDYGDAADLHRQAVAIYREIGNRVGEANALNNLGIVQVSLGHYAESASLHRQALAIYREVDSSLGQAGALEYLGGVQWWFGDHVEATALLRQALDLYRETGNRRGEADTLDDLGIVAWRTGDYTEASDLHVRAQALYCQIGERRGEADTYLNLGNVYRRTGDYATAVTLYGQASTIYREMGNRRGEPDALNNLGNVFMQTGDYRVAADLHGQALAICREAGDRRRMAAALNNLGGVRWRTGSHGEAASLLGQALAICREIGDRLGEVEVLNETGQLLTQIGELRSALATFSDALELARRIRSKFEQARALEGGACCLASLGHTDVAVTQLAEAIEIFRRIGVPEVGPAVSRLAALRSDL